MSSLPSLPKRAGDNLAVRQLLPLAGLLLLPLLLAPAAEAHHLMHLLHLKPTPLSEIGRAHV